MWRNFVQPNIRQAEATLTLQVDEWSRSVLVDEIHVQHVLVNLIKNGGEIRYEIIASHHSATDSIGAN